MLILPMTGLGAVSPQTCICKDQDCRDLSLNAQANGLVMVTKRPKILYRTCKVLSGTHRLKGIDMAQSDRDVLTANQVDQLVGDRIRRRRILMGLTQDQLGEALGISYQQIQKYETGANRVSAGRLYLIAKKLEVSPGWFFDPSKSDTTSDDFDGIGSSRLPMGFVRGFPRIEDERVKTLLVSLVRAMGGAEETETQPPASQNGYSRPNA